MLLNGYLLLLVQWGRGLLVYGTLGPGQCLLLFGYLFGLRNGLVNALYLFGVATVLGRDNGLWTRRPTLYGRYAILLRVDLGAVLSVLVVCGRHFTGRHAALYTASVGGVQGRNGVAGYGIVFV